VASATTDTDEPADFQLGALARGDYLQVSVQSGQASPGLSAAVRDEIAEYLLPAADRLAEVAKAWRGRVLAEVNDPDSRRQLLNLFADRSILQMEMTQPGSGVNKLTELLKLYFT
jgi:siroheme synthase (precorrin-2 oxidase/ferrochelatase)